MRKIPTLFVRDPENMSRVLPEVNLAAQWVIDGEGVATRKFDGTCTMLDDEGQWWARREVKPGKQPPPDFEAVETDETTGKTVGWEPLGQSSFYKAFCTIASPPHDPGTYELCGPRVNKNPEDFDRHVLVPHGYQVWGDAPRDYDGLRKLLTGADFIGEGIVWHHPDGRMAKLKRRDFP